MRYNRKYPPPRPLTSEEQRLVLENIGLVHKAVNGFIWKTIRRRGLHPRSHRHAEQLREELFGAGIVGMCIGVQRHDPRRGVKLSSYVYWWVGSYVRRALKRAQLRIGAENGIGLPIRVFTEIGCGIAFDVWDCRADPLNDDSEELPTDVALIMFLLLREREYAVIKEHVFGGVPFQNIADREGISKQRIEQVYARGIGKLRCCRDFMRLLEERTCRERELNADDFRGTNVKMLLA